MIYDERDFGSRRYLVLLASRPRGNRDHGRVWTHRNESFLLTDARKIENVTSIVDWLQAVGLLEATIPRSLGGRFLVPTPKGVAKLDDMLHGGIKEEDK